MSQVSSGHRAARHRPKHAQVSGRTPRTLICAALVLALGFAASVAGSGGSTGGVAANAAVPHVNGSSSAPAAGQDVERSSADAVVGVEHPLGTAGAITSKAGDLGLAEISDRFPASGLAGDGIPVTALTAYQNAAARETTRMPDCGITWPLLAGIGRVESDHGRFAGAVLHADGLSTPPVIGIALNGHGTALIRDTDNGVLDGDTVYDRAVGPMQFIPSTWASWGVDANGDGVKDPFNIFDAAAAAADYLCAAGRDLTTTHGQVQAILSYNYSWDYVSMVMGVERVYASGAVGITVPVLPTTPDQHGRPKHKPSLPPVDPGPPAGTTSGGGNPKPTPTPKPTRTTPQPTPSSTATTPVPSDSGSSSSSDSPSPSEPSCPTGAVSPASSDSPTPAASGCPSPSASDSSSAQNGPLSSDVASSTDPTQTGP